MTMTQLSTNPRLGIKMWATAPTADTTAPTVTLTEPSSGSGVIVTKNANTALLTFFTGGGAENDTADVILYGWSQTTGTNPTWIPHYMAKYNLITGTTAGVATGTVADTDLFVDTIGHANGDSTHKINSNGVNGIAALTVDLEGASYLELEFANIGGGSAEAEDMNAIVNLF